MLKAVYANDHDKARERLEKNLARVQKRLRKATMDWTLPGTEEVQAARAATIADLGKEATELGRRISGHAAEAEKLASLKSRLEHGRSRVVKLKDMYDRASISDRREVRRALIRRVVVAPDLTVAVEVAPF